VKRRVLLVRDDDGNQMTIGPVGTDQSVGELRQQVTGRGWTVLAVPPHYSRADFTGANGHGMGPARRSHGDS
jgi:hypothetical protein